MIQFETEQVWQARGRGFAMGVIAHHGRLVHLTGQVAWDVDENIIGVGDVVSQTRQCFLNIQSLLGSIGGTLDDIVSITTWYTAQNQLPLIQSVRNEFLTDGNEPASASVMIAGLGHPDFLVEMTPIAVIPEDRLSLK